MSHSLNVSALVVMSGCIAVWGVLAARLERVSVSAPTALVVLGLASTHGPITLTHLHLHSSTIRSVAEVTLALVLFADASRVNGRALLADRGVPTRLLAIGLPLTIGFGTAAGAVLLNRTGLWVAALVAAIVAPTDAALGASIIQDPRVPVRVRRTLNVESGLNDGIATPFVNLFLAGALASELVRTPGVGRASVDLLGGAGIGAAVGLAGAIALAWSRRHRWSSEASRTLAVLAIAVLAYSASLLAGTNGFVAAFVAGVAYGSATPPHLVENRFCEEAGTLLSLLVWFAFGAVMLVPGLEAVGWREVVFALLAISVVRMVPVAISLTGSGLDRATVAFIGWFGPRGLASVVFGLLAVDSLAPADANVVLGTVTMTVALSVVLHGATASPLARRYGARASGLHPTRPEHIEAEALRARTLGVLGQAPSHPATGRTTGSPPVR